MRTKNEQGTHAQGRPERRSGLGSTACLGTFSFGEESGQDARSPSQLNETS